MFDCIIVAISRSIEIVVPLYESAWLGNEVWCFCFLGSCGHGLFSLCLTVISWDAFV